MLRAGTFEYFNNSRKSNEEPLKYKNINKFFEPQTKRYHQPRVVDAPVSSALYCCRFLNMWKAASVLSALSLYRAELCESHHSLRYPGLATEIAILFHLFFVLH